MSTKQKINKNNYPKLNSMARNAQNNNAKAEIGNKIKKIITKEVKKKMKKGNKFDRSSPFNALVPINKAINLGNDLNSNLNFFGTKNRVNRLMQLQNNMNLEVNSMVKVNSEQELETNKKALVLYNNLTITPTDSNESYLSMFLFGSLSGVQRPGSKVPTYCLRKIYTQSTVVNSSGNALIVCQPTQLYANNQSSYTTFFYNNDDTYNPSSITNANPARCWDMGAVPKALLDAEFPFVRINHIQMEIVIKRTNMLQKKGVLYVAQPTVPEVYAGSVDQYGSTITNNLCLSDIKKHPTCKYYSLSNGNISKAIINYVPRDTDEYTSWDIGAPITGPIHGPRNNSGSPIMVVILNDFEAHLAECEINYYIYYEVQPFLQQYDKYPPRITTNDEVPRQVHNKLNLLNNYLTQIYN